MYTNPSNIIKTMVCLLDRNAQFINSVVEHYESNRKMVVLEGMRPTLPVGAFPSFEVEPGNSDNQWATTRAQRPTYNFTCNLTVKVSNIEYGVEYICTLANAVTEILTSPNNLQMKILNETKWDVNEGLVDTYILDSFVSSVTYNATKEGSIRGAEFTWFATVHEPYPESLWKLGDTTAPTIVRPIVLT